MRWPVSGRSDRSTMAAVVTLALAALCSALCCTPAAADSGVYGARPPLCRTNTGAQSFELGAATITVLSDGFNDFPLSYLFVDSIPIVKRVIQCAPPPRPPPPPCKHRFGSVAQLESLRTDPPCTMC